MNTYLISYDVSDDTVRNSLCDAIKSYGTWAHVTESFWAIKSDKPATLIRDEFALLIRPTDRVFVAQSAHIAAWRNVLCKNEWLKENV